MASPLVIRKFELATTAKPSLVPVAAKEASITAAIARIASGRQAA
jgi:vacuolar-type H+-ATPase catalytic subunit A/Vma1